MLMKKEKKPLASIIMTKMTQPPMEEAGPSPEHMLAEDMMAAIQSRDAAALTEALKAFIEVCMNEGYEEPELGE